MFSYVYCVQAMATKMEKLYQELAEYFVFDKQKYTLEEFFSDIKTFKDLFKQVGGIFNKRLTLLIPCIVGVWFHIKRTRVWSQAGPRSGGEREGGAGKLDVIMLYLEHVFLISWIIIPCWLSLSPSCFPLSIQGHILSVLLQFLQIVALYVMK